MGLLGALFGGGGGTTKIGKQASQELWSKAKQVANQPFTPYQGVRVADLTQTQNMGLQTLIDAARSNVGAGAVNSAISLAQQAAAYKPTMVTPGTLAATSMTPVADVAAAAVDRSGIGNVSAGSFLGGDMAAYMNPYIRQVIDTTLTDLNRQRDIQRQADNARAVKAQAFGGSRQAVADAQTGEAFSNTMASTLAGLYSQGYDRASALMMQDYDRAMQAQQANQGIDASVASQNASLWQQAALTNQSNQYNQSYQNALLRDQAARTNLEASLQAQQLNQAAGLSSANLGLNAATQLGVFGKSQQEMAIAKAQALMQGGEAQHAVEQAKLDADYQEFLRKVGYDAQMIALMQGAAGVAAGTRSNTSEGILPSFVPLFSPSKK